MAKRYAYVLGIDCGTTNIKGVVLREDGKTVASAGFANTFYQPGPGRQEQDAQQWWQTVVQILQSLTEQIGSSEVPYIKGICVSSHTVTLLPVDRQGVPLRMAMTYQDSRSSEELAYILEKVGRNRYVQIAGGQPSVAFLPGKLLWYRQQEPQLYEKTAWLLQASSYINYKLTGVMSQDIDQALRTQCMDTAAQQWSPEIGQAIGVDLEEKMPPVYPVDTIIGTVTKEAAAVTGLVSGIPVLAGCSDAMASMYATGMSRLGEAGESSGTTSLVFVGSEHGSPADVPVVARPCFIDGMPWVFDAPIQSSGAAVKWFIDHLGAEECTYAQQHNLNIYDYLNQLAAGGDPGAKGLFFFPYLMGERAPLWNDYASGMLIGLRMDMTRGNLVRSVFEGTAYALRHVMETVRESGGQAQLLRICGGGAASRTWNQIKASMLNMPVHVISSESGNVPVGDALIAGHRTGVFPDLPEASKKIIRVSEIIDPDPVWVKVYDSLYPHYIELYRSLDPQLKCLQDTLRKGKIQP